MPISIISGNIFNSNSQTIVNTVNCVGVMGKGIALVFKLRYPKLFDEYFEKCKRREIAIGKLWLYKSPSFEHSWVLNFPTKYHWKYPSKFEYIEKGLKAFANTYKELGITSIAFPLLGTHNGSLDTSQVKELMAKYLNNIDIPIEVYEYDPIASDDLYQLFISKWRLLSKGQIKTATGIRSDRLKIITDVIESNRLASMISLINEPGIGLKTMERCFSFVMSSVQQNTLF